MYNRKDLLKKYKEAIKAETPIPIYYQTVLLLNEIIENQLEEGEVFFTEEEISEQLEISRPTVNRAMKILIEKGIITRERSKRSVINKKKDVPLVFMSELLTYGEMINKLKLKHHTKLLERKLITPSTKTRKNLQIDNQDKVIYIKRIRYIEDKPITIVDSYIPAFLEKILVIDEEEFSNDLYDIYYNYYKIEVKKSVREVKTAKITFEDSILLELPIWESTLRLYGITYSTDNRPIEYFDSRFNGNRCSLKSTIYKD